MLVQRANRGGDLVRGAVALDADGEDEDVEEREAAGERLKDVADGGAGRARERTDC